LYGTVHETGTMSAWAESQTATCCTSHKRVDSWENCACSCHYGPQDHSTAEVWYVLRASTNRSADRHWV